MLTGSPVAADLIFPDKGDCKLGRETDEVGQLKENAAVASALLRAMSNECRLLILCHLLERPQSVTELEQLVDLSQSALSQHLAVLRRQGLIRARRESRSIFYSISSEPVVAVMNTLYEEFCNPAAKSASKIAEQTLTS